MRERLAELESDYQDAREALGITLAGLIDADDALDDVEDALDDENAVSAISQAETDVRDIRAVAVEALTYDSVATTIVTRKVPRHGREPLLMLAKRSGGLWYPVEPGNTQAPFDEWADELGLDYDTFMYRATSQAPALRRQAAHA